MSSEDEEFLSCEHCDEAAAEYFCASCSLYYCEECCVVLHRASSKRNHHLEPIDLTSDIEDEEDDAGEMSDAAMMSEDELDTEPTASARNSKVAAAAASEEALPPPPPAEVLAEMGSGDDVSPELPPPPAEWAKSVSPDAEAAGEAEGEDEVLTAKEKTNSVPRTPTVAIADFDKEESLALAEADQGRRIGTTPDSDLAGSSPTPTWTRTEKAPQPVLYMEWSCCEVCTYFDDLGAPFNKYTNNLYAEDIHGRALVRLTAALLERMNITDPKDQQAILNEVVRLRLTRQMSLITRLEDDPPEWIQGMSMEAPAQDAEQQQQLEPQQAPEPQGTAQEAGDKVPELPSAAPPSAEPNAPPSKIRPENLPPRKGFTQRRSAAKLATGAMATPL